MRPVLNKGPGGPSRRTRTWSTEPTPLPGITRANTSKLEQKPWAPLVLSLDGGGIRGLSELFILRRIMGKIQQKIDDAEKDGVENPFLFGPDNTALPLLPCYFFDYMVGTSTGGLVSVMLGRLRMSVDETIKAYWRLGNYVFYPRRYIRSYSSKKLKKAIIGTIRENCGCHQNGKHCGDQELLRQYDYAERDDYDVSYREHPERGNFTCKVVLVAQKKGGSTQATHLFRSYNHCQRFENEPQEYNPGSLGRSQTKIWEACRATSAAPYYFRNMTIDADQYLDGGAGNNNPSNIAWNEAKWMSALKDPHIEGEVAGLVSLGCGDKTGLDLFGNQKSVFYIAKALKHGRNQITETQKADNETRNHANSSGAAYFRFTVKPITGDSGHDGLSGVKLSECKKMARSGWRKATRDAAKSIASVLRRSSDKWEEQQNSKEKAPLVASSASLAQMTSSSDTAVLRARVGGDNNIQPENNSSAFSSKEPTPPPQIPVLLNNTRPQWYTDLQQQAQQNKKNSFKPRKYDYVTFNTIFDRTEDYLCHTEGPGGENVEKLIENCADFLLRYARERQMADSERWKYFVSHPNPEHPLYLRSEIRKSERRTGDRI
ncbi:acyl transferase/acyl hydrolase/lysophospholipase [Podospora fimiseda]|uniref:Acyl transferase/acyl hydrolase/lysophospholipase n=1 Tax=Podospora fimiseda TaxID=252190 RepID=A0AAN7BLK2_9PEZI|nr:acyl transferase/acyl hydrolase/lysophospholipase [Podospora fimiseda]